LAEALALLRKQLAAFNVACRAYLHARLPMTIIGQWVGSTPQPMLHVNRFGDIDPAGRGRHSASALMMVGTINVWFKKKTIVREDFSRFVASPSRSFWPLVQVTCWSNYLQTRVARKMADPDYVVGSISDFLKTHGEELPDQEKEIESSSDEEDDEEFELRLQLALRQQLTNQDGKAGDWMAQYENDSDEEEEDEEDDATGAQGKAPAQPSKDADADDSNDSDDSDSDDEADQEPAAKKTKKSAAPKAPTKPEHHVAEATSVYVVSCECGISASVVVCRCDRRLTVCRLALCAADTSATCHSLHQTRA